MSAAAAEVAALSRSVVDLRMFERKYRARLREHLTSLLDELNRPDGPDEWEWERQEIIGPAWSLIAPGLEIRANGNSTRGRVCIEIRQVTP
jgi:hypothetical protein